VSEMAGDRNDDHPAPSLEGQVGAPERRTLAELVAEARRLDMGRVHILAWRDLDDPEAGGSELHAHRIASLWAAAGLDVTMRASRADGQPMFAERAGYKVVRKSGRYAVFARSTLSGAFRRHGRNDGWVEIWNGMPFFSPLWATGPRMVFLHHVHAEMWQMTLPPNLARVGRFVEQRLAPPLYRRTSLVTLSESSRDEIVSMLKMRPERVTVVPPGVEPRFTPGGVRSETPLVVAVGRLVPVKRFDALLDALAKIKVDHPAMRAVIVGEGYERSRLEARRHELGADDWIDMPGKLADEELIEVYRRAWVLVSSSLREGWGMTVTEAGACGTPAVVTRIAGHEDAVDDGVSGVLVDDPGGIAGAVSELIADPARRARLAAGAIRHAGLFTWEATASGTLGVLVDEARKRHPSR
jgi:glycosyltransferase involved in cell wall biosynthesis